MPTSPVSWNEQKIWAARFSKLCVKVGGSITGEHGVGREKINQMCSQFNADELTLFHAVKAAFDPSGLLNPGKNIPTASLRRIRPHAHPQRPAALSPNWSVSDVRNRQRRQRAVAGPGQPGARRQRPRCASRQRQQGLPRPRGRGQLLDVREHRGIVSYDPTELVVTARAGTPLAELEATLDEAGQCCLASRRTLAKAPPSAA